MTYNDPQPQYPGDYRAQPEHIPPTYNPERNGLGIAALICAIIGLLFCLMPLTGFIGFGLGVIAFILGLAGVARVRKNKASNGKTAWTGVILGVAAIVFGVWGMVTFFTAVDQLGTDLENIGNDMESYGECIDSNPVESWAEVCD